MSFILDALKKSESDRQRHTGPALFEVKIAPPKARFPLWAIVVIALLVVNSIIVGWLVLRRGSHGDEAAATAANATPAAAGQIPNTVSAGGGAAAAGNPTAATAVSAPPAPLQTTQTAGASSAGPATSAATPSAASAATPPAVLPPNGSGPAMNDADGNEPTLGGNSHPGRESADDLAPAAEPAGDSPFRGHVRRGTESGYVLYQDAALVPGSGLPQLRLDLHVYAGKPQERFALINMHRLHEGDSTPEGVRVETIIPEGVVMSHNGQKFLLPRD